MRTAAICPTCATYTNALCVIYNGIGLTNINVAPLDDLETIIQNINDNLVPIYGAGAPTNSAVYEGQIYIDNSTGEIYIATSTGGGAGDWDQLALQSAIPSTPSLDDVLTVGNTSTQNIVIQNLSVAPTQKVTIQPINIFIEDTSLNLQTAYNVNNILVENTNTGNQLQINIDNLQNQTIDFPDNSGTLVLSVNGNTADSAGNVTIAGGGIVNTIKVSLTSADILALNATPFTLIAAQGAGTIINVLKVWYLYNFVTTPYTGGGSLTVTMGPINIAPAVSNILNSSSNLLGRPSTSVGTTTTSFGYDNTPILLNCSAAQTLGDSTLDVYLTYDVITL